MMNGNFKNKNDKLIVNIIANRFCDLVCPENCRCAGLYVSCYGANFTSLPNDIKSNVRKLDLTKNQLGPSLSLVDFSLYQDLGELILQWNSIETLLSRKFLLLRNLYNLDLRNNRIVVIKEHAFAGLRRVTSLLLNLNPTLETIEAEAFVGLSNLLHLNISDSNIHKLEKNIFWGLTSLQTLEFRGNGLEKISGGSFLGLESLVSLDLRENDIMEFSQEIFTGLKSLMYLNTDSFKFCCMVSHQVPLQRCNPPPDEISDCEDLMSSLVQRYLVWLLAAFALMGNLFVIIWRIRTRLYINPVSSTLILSLGCADFLMGIYLIIIASVDVHYR